MIAKDAFCVRYAPLLKDGPVVLVSIGAHVNAGELYAMIKGETNKRQSTYAVVSACCPMIFPGLHERYVKTVAGFNGYTVQFSFPGLVPKVCPLFAAALSDLSNAFCPPEHKKARRKKAKRKPKNTATIREATPPARKRRKR